MKKFLGLTILGLIAVPASPAQDVRSIVSRSESAIVSIEALDYRGDIVSQGTGFIVDTGYLVTCEHVVQRSPMVLAYLSDGTMVEAQLTEYYDNELDVALLRLEREWPTGLTLASTPPEVGAPVVVIGSPRGLSNTVSRGIVSAIRSIEGIEVIQFDAAASPGSSGSPILSETGQVIGMVVVQFVDGQNLNFGLSAKHLRDFINTAKAGRGVRANEQVAQSGERYSLVVYSDRSEQAARDVATRYRQAGFEANVISAGERSVRYRVCIGAFSERDEAVTYRDRLAGKHIPRDAWVIRLP